MNFTKTLIAISLLALLSACGGDDDDSSASTGTFNLGVSDNPADAKVVNIAFKQIVLKNSQGSISFDVSEDGELKHVDLLTVQGKQVEMLTSGQEVAVGEYQMCLYMKNSVVADIDSSYVKTMDGNEAGLTTNSNGSCGGVGAEEDDTGRLFFNKKFTIAAGNNNFVAEFDLAKGLQSPKGNKNYWVLKPTAVQVVNMSEVGAISGEISSDVISECEMEAKGSEFSGSVYLYPEQSSLELMGDFRSSDIPTTTDQVTPIAAARVNEIKDSTDEVIGYGYEFGFVAANTYSLGYTCVAQNDDPEEANGSDDVDSAFFVYSDQQDVIVTNEQTIVRDFD